MGRAGRLKGGASASLIRSGQSTIFVVRCLLLVTWFGWCRFFGDVCVCARLPVGLWFLWCLVCLLVWLVLVFGIALDMVIAFIFGDLSAKILRRHPGF